MVIRFISSYYRKRVGVEEFVDLRPWNPKPKVLDAGCGIGRHVHLFDRYGFDAWGVDGSSEAVAAAHLWRVAMSKPTQRITHNSLQSLPFETEFFDCVVSHSVLDSMSFDDAVLSIREIDRILSRTGLLCFDLIRHDHRAPSHDFADEIIVTSLHEHGTIQSYFNFEKILKLLDETRIKLLEATVVTRERLDPQQESSRWHLVGLKT